MYAFSKPQVNCVLKQPTAGNRDYLYSEFCYFFPGNQQPESFLKVDVSLLLSEDSDYLLYLDGRLFISKV